MVMGCLVKINGVDTNSLYLIVELVFVELALKIKVIF